MYNSWIARSKGNVDFGEAARIHLHGVGGRTLEKLERYDFPYLVSKNPDVVILEVGSNDLPHLNAETVGSAIESLQLLIFGSKCRHVLLVFVKF